LTCQEAFFVDAVKGCQECHASCANCSGPTIGDCTECNDEKAVLIEGSCVNEPKKCEEPEFLDVT